MLSTANISANHWKSFEIAVWHLTVRFAHFTCWLAALMFLYSLVKQINYSAGSQNITCLVQMFVYVFLHALHYPCKRMFKILAGSDTRT